MAMHSYGKAPNERIKEAHATVHHPHAIFGEINTAADTGWGGVDPVSGTDSAAAQARMRTVI